MKNKKLFAILTLVCFMMTLMPVAAFAVDSDDSYIFTTDKNVEVGVDDEVEVQFDFAKDEKATTVYVWFIKDNAKYATSNVSSADVDANAENVFELKKADFEKGEKAIFKFSVDGTYTVQAAFAKPDAKVSEATKKLGNIAEQKTVVVTTSTTSRDYGMIFNSTMVTKIVGAYQDVEKAEKETYEGDSLTDAVRAHAFQDGVTYYIDGVEANNVANKEISLKFVDEDGNAVKGETVTFETGSSNIELNKEKATTDPLGKVDFKIAGVRDGSYKLFVKCGSYEATIIVNVGATGAAYINVAKEPTAPIDIDATNLSDFVRFTFTDINGNAVTNAKAQDNGAENAFDSAKSGDTPAYVSVISQPSASKLKDSDLKLVARNTASGTHAYEATIESKREISAEGTYEFKVVLDNGNYKTVKVEVKEFQTPVDINLTYSAPSVELNSVLYVDKLEYVDANGVVRSAKGKVDLAATGYAVADFNTTDGTIKVKPDEKYVGSTITVTAVDERYNLVKTVDLTVADEAKDLKFASKTGEVNANNIISVYVADANGNRVAIGRGAKVVDHSISYVVLDKPEGAKVAVNTYSQDNNLLSAGSFKMSLTSNKIGNVTVQAIAKVTYTDENANKEQQTVVKYYTGTQIFAIGNGSAGDVVVMSIGSHEIVVNDAKATIDAAPMIQNDRTFVPFRALAEAFGAEVAYDEATQAVTAKLNGVEVVMTIGSATYTVNGAEKTADVAPFINGSRTMVPVRFAAEAFGIKVIPTYNPDGTTADILFNL